MNTLCPVLKKIFICSACATLWLGSFLLLPAQAEQSFFEKSLHFTGEGMRHAYEREDGLMSLTGIPYKNLDCKNCHVQSCDPCHARRIGENFIAYSEKKAHDPDTCLVCHTRAKATLTFGKANGTLDVHAANGMTCADCHKGEDVHGDGTVHTSMREPGALKVSCTSCHTYDTSIDAHMMHEDTLECAACHVSNTTACMNCHFDSFVKTGKRKGNFEIMQSWLLLVNHEGKVTSGTAMSFVSNKQKFIVYAPYYTHSIMKKGRSCAECHENDAMKLIQKGETVPMMTFKNGTVQNWGGVAPTVPDKLDWVYLDKSGDSWVPLESEKPEKIQWWYAEPLTESQIESLSVSYD